MRVWISEKNHSVERQLKVDVQRLEDKVEDCIGCLERGEKIRELQKAASVEVNVLKD